VERILLPVSIRQFSSSQVVQLVFASSSRSSAAWSWRR